QVDLLGALVRWVEQGQAPAGVVAAARGPASNAPNPELPAGWSPTRTRLLCPYPQVARYRSGDPERADSFVCSAPGP
ncbi:MAG: tannase/feruloyl esterase family alpha/beta hydrolase, partial [Ottowia sp.]|nr:tannase/feruloyl esterase family alpha/beta hydrolase [Ottowia sp.]